ncbi:MAG: hypothetical protein Kow0031_15160 [Anaerolineae bacterium]
MNQPRFKSPPAQFALAATISGLIYLLVFTLPYLLPTHYNITPPVDYTKLTGYSRTGFAAYLAGLAGLFACYLWGLKLMTSAGRVLKASWLFGSSAAFAAILLAGYPLTAIDLFIYAIRTRGWALYGLPPLLTPPEMLPAADPWLGLAGEWVDAASPYGPLWELLSLGAFHLGGGSFLAHLLLLKLLGAAATLGSAALIYLTLRRLQPAWALAGTLAFAWNPLVLFEAVQNAHNDIVMTFFLLAALWLAVTRPASVPTHAGVLLLLAASILVKFVTVLAAPFILLALVARQTGRAKRLAAIMLYGLLLVGLVAAALWPYWPGWDNWAVLEAGSQAGRSLPALLILALRDSLGTNAAFAVAGNLTQGLFGLIYLFLLWRSAAASRWQAGQPQAEMGVSLAVWPTFYALFWYVLLAAPVFHAWYLLWFVPLASLLLPAPRPLRVAIVFSMTALAVIPYFETVRVWYPLLLQNHLLGHLVGVPLLVLPPLLTALWPISPPPQSEV